ncbi:MAG: hypothetical protein L6R39_006448 [Caloplaca ligustica]|nr:MAG: hypothetical protein L6R39_006448 [Caloplaca ligustica]
MPHGEAWSVKLTWLDSTAVPSASTKPLSVVLEAVEEAVASVEVDVVAAAMVVAVEATEVEVAMAAEVIAMAEEVDMIVPEVEVVMTVQAEEALGKYDRQQRTTEQWLFEDTQIAQPAKAHSREMA